MFFTEVKFVVRMNSRGASVKIALNGSADWVLCYIKPSFCHCYAKDSHLLTLSFH